MLNLGHFGFWILLFTSFFFYDCRALHATYYEMALSLSLSASSSVSHERRLAYITATRKLSSPTWHPVWQAKWVVTYCPLTCEANGFQNLLLDIILYNFILCKPKCYFKCAVSSDILLLVLSQKLLNLRYWPSFVFSSHTHFVIIHRHISHANFYVIWLVSVYE